MAEAKKNYSNIETIGSLLGAEGIGSLLKNVQSTEKKVGDILRKLSDLESAARSPCRNIFSMGFIPLTCCCAGCCALRCTAT